MLDGRAFCEYPIKDQAELQTVDLCQTFGCLANRRSSLRLESGQICEIDELVFCLPEKKRMSIYVHRPILLPEAVLPPEATSALARSLTALPSFPAVIA